MSNRSFAPHLRFALLTACSMAAGLASRSLGHLLPDFLKLYAGDTIWAVMVFLGISMFVPATALRWRAALALAFCWAIEFSQLYQAPWINALRRTSLGGLVLGFGFLWSDLACYSVGIVTAVCLERALRGTRKRHTVDGAPSSALSDKS